ncbi:ABC transporter permease [Pediococcus pentosaceus]|uniref:ABC transporter permease n=1 Tax=Pediococcus pentosaceus TaxID=1255 RepID=UPI001E595539|nr:ABC transporter permease [Pediococcus pentosaceus]
MNKVASVIKYDLSYFVRLILIVYLWLIGLLVGIPVLLHLVASGTEGMVIAILNDLSLLTTAALFVNVALLFYFGFLTYEHFSFLIQNGISRRTGWYAKVISILIVALIGNIYSFITGLFALNGGSGYKSVPYLELYGHFFKSLPLDLVSMFIVNYIMLVMLAVFVIIAGAVFALLTRKNQKIVAISIPILGILLLAILERIVIRQSHILDPLVAFLKFAMGYSKTLGYFNPIIPATGMVILIVLSLIISRWLNTLLRTKRGE